MNSCYNKFYSQFKDYIETIDSLYRLSASKESEITEIYTNIRSILIEKYKTTPQTILSCISKIVTYRNKHLKAYLALFKMIYDDFHPETLNFIDHKLFYYFWKEYNIVLADFSEFKVPCNIYNENTIFYAIMNDNADLLYKKIDANNYSDLYYYNSNIFPAHGNTILELCCYYGAINCFKMIKSEFNEKLFHLSANCTSYSFLSGNPDIMNQCLTMEYAIISHNIDFISFLMNEYNIEIDREKCYQYNNLSALFLLMDQSENINSFFPMSPILDIPSFCETFLESGVDINQGDKFNLTALHFAVINRRSNILKLLICYGADINAQDDNKESALHFAVYNNNMETVKILVESKIDINIKNYAGMTPLIMAAKYNSIEIAKYLILQGANLSIKDIHGKSAIHYVAKLHDISLMHILISSGADVNDETSEKETPLMIATRKCNESMVKNLIARGTDVNRQDQNGKTALHLSALYDSPKIAEFLLSNGTKIDTKTNDGYTAFDYAKKFNNEIMNLIQKYISQK